MRLSAQQKYKLVKVVKILMGVRWLLATSLILTCWMNLAILGVVKPKATTIAHGLTRESKISLAKRQSKLNILIPLYIYPNWYDRDKYIWKQVVVAAKKVPITAIINPNNGPNGTPPNVDYQQGIRDLRQAGVRIVGYVHSNYGKRDLNLVKADIDLYTKHFNVDGIFIDETASSRDKLDYYQKVYQYIKSQRKSLQVIINPGTHLDESYMKKPVADVAVIFENDRKVWNAYQPPVYIQNYSAPHFAALVHTAANKKVMKGILDRAINANFGYVYITNDSTNTANHNPWDSLPSYWQAEVDYIQKLNASF
jgi:Spherulation-specific family 4